MFLVSYLSKHRSTALGAWEKEKRKAAPKQRRRSGKEKNSCIYSCDKIFTNIFFTHALSTWILFCANCAETQISFRLPAYLPGMHKKVFSFTQLLSENFGFECFNQKRKIDLLSTGAFEFIKLEQAREEIKNFNLIRKLINWSIIVWWFGMNSTMIFQLKVPKNVIWKFYHWKMLFVKWVLLIFPIKSMEQCG